jgi:hypothetical protein
MDARASRFQLCFRSLFDAGRGYAFPCDDAGRVDLDHLSERARINYLYARAMVGRELAVPAVECRACVEEMAVFSRKSPPRAQP